MPVEPQYCKDLEPPERVVNCEKSQAEGRVEVASRRRITVASDCPAAPDGGAWPGFLVGCGGLPFTSTSRERFALSQPNWSAMRLNARCVRFFTVIQSHVLGR
jgi:hypothetical protein